MDCGNMWKNLSEKHRRGTMAKFLSPKRKVVWHLCRAGLSKICCPVQEFKLLR